jgi:hypothetical protein
MAKTVAEQLAGVTGNDVLRCRGQKDGGRRFDAFLFSRAVFSRLYFEDVFLLGDTTSPMTPAGWRPRGPARRWPAVPVSGRPVAVSPDRAGPVCTGRAAIPGLTAIPI